MIASDYFGIRIGVRYLSINKVYKKYLLLHQVYAIFLILWNTYLK